MKNFAPIMTFFALIASAILVFAFDKGHLDNISLWYPQPESQATGADPGQSEEPIAIIQGESDSGPPDFPALLLLAFAGLWGILVIIKLNAQFIKWSIAAWVLSSLWKNSNGSKNIVRILKELRSDNSLGHHQS